MGQTLRIGNHLNDDKGNRVKVDRIEDAQVGYITQDNDWFGVDPCEDWLEFIPITDSLLRKIGFVGDGYDVYIDHKSACIIREDTTQIPDVRICKCQDGLWGVAMQNSMFHCKYLHELENMFYHVFGKELVE